VIRIGIEVWAGNDRNAFVRRPMRQGSKVALCVPVFDTHAQKPSTKCNVKNGLFRPLESIFGKCTQVAIIVRFFEKARRNWLDRRFFHLWFRFLLVMVFWSFLARGFSKNVLLKSPTPVQIWSDLEGEHPPFFET